MGTGSIRESGPQRRIGLTGGIASGKSSVGRLLAERWGLPVLDADSYAREALAPGSPGAQAVAQRYGTSVAGGEPPQVDRVALGRIVFADAAERRWLEELVHPIVRGRFDQELARRSAEPTVVLMVPLLFEAGLEGLCSETWIVDCDQEQQEQRLLQRDDLDQQQACRRIAAQWPLASKRKLADVVIDNRGAPEALEVQVERALALSP
ncbi:MAG: dephospho-CoA kinase [Prochlorococcaceae cyanobacterium]